MIVGNLDVPRFAIPPFEADPPLIVDADAVLAPTIAVQRLQTVARRHTQVVESLRGIDRQKLRTGAPLHLQRQTPHGVAYEDRCSALVRETLDHDQTYRETVRRVNGFVPRLGTPRTLLTI